MKSLQSGCTIRSGHINIETRSFNATKDIIAWHRVLYKDIKNIKLKEWSWNKS